MSMTTAQITRQYTRADYMGGQCTHAEYYRQFVDDSILETVRDYIGIEHIRNSTNQGEGRYFITEAAV